MYSDSGSFMSFKVAKSYLIKLQFSESVQNGLSICFFNQHIKTKKKNFRKKVTLGPTNIV